MMMTDKAGTSPQAQLTPINPLPTNTHLCRGDAPSGNPPRDLSTHGSESTRAVRPLGFEGDGDQRSQIKDSPTPGARPRELSDRAALWLFGLYLTGRIGHC